jgi:signal transduction histidine kinase
MPPDQQSKLFQRFWQGNAGPNTRGGTGFGLYLCSLITRTHRGTIECSSDVGAGTTITVTLPAFQASENPSKEIATSQA